jgi:4'-phosphopantetheinyl transferase EntD
LLEEIVPPGVRVAEAFGEPGGGTLFPEETAVIARAGDKRRREFTAVRACAREAMRLAGLPPAPIVPGARGAPGWPAGVVGSMTHCAGYRACAVAPASVVAALGIDAEPHAALPDGVLAVVTSPAERQALARLAAAGAGAGGGTWWDRILFSAKESVYKAWYPGTGRWLGFEDVELTLDRLAGTFTATLLVPGPMIGGEALTRYDGRWLVREGLILTAVAVLAPEPG